MCMYVCEHFCPLSSVLIISEGPMNQWSGKFVGRKRINTEVFTCYSGNQKNSPQFVVATASYDTHPWTVSSVTQSSLTHSVTYNFHSNVLNKNKGAHVCPLAHWSKYGLSGAIHHHLCHSAPKVHCPCHFLA